MKIKLAVGLIAVAGAILFSFGCDKLFGGSPTATVKSYHSFAEKGDAASMTKLFSSAAVRERGEERIKDDNKYFSEIIEKQIATGNKPKFFDAKEEINGNGAVVKFRYGDQAGGTGSLPGKCELVKENGEWKIEKLSGDY